MRKCTKCGKEKDRSSFYKNGRFLHGQCKSCTKISHKKSYKEDSRKAKEYSKTWSKNNPDKVKKYSRKKHQNKKIRVVERYGRNKGCVCCKVTEISFLSIDHIKDDGAEDKRKHPEIKGNFYGYLIRNNFPIGYQTLCMNCQMGKRANGGFCPHHPKKDLRQP